LGNDVAGEYGRYIVSYNLEKNGTRVIRERWKMMEFEGG
jgi:hypothetical protein